MISAYSKSRARDLGVTIRESTQATKKLDVFRGSRKVASIGAKGMMDYPTYVKLRGKTYAKKRRRLYKLRHERDRHVRNSPGFYADNLLW